MKKIICVLSVIIIAVTFASCQKEESVSAQKPSASTTGVADLLNGKSAEDFDYFESNATTKKAAELKTKKTSEADIDMTGLNANMVYSQIYDIMTKPDTYEGKTMKISGVFSTFEDETTGNRYFSCFVADAAACCQQGLEFELTDDYAYPADYPEENGEITVYGTFETYMEGENKYCHLKDAVFTD